MKTWAFFEGSKPRVVDLNEKHSDADFLWVLTNREELDSVLAFFKERDQLELHQEHYEDCFNELHPCFYDATDDYSFLIYRGVEVDSKDPINSPAKPAAFILFDKVLISVAEEGSTVSRVSQRLADGKRQPPKEIHALLYHILIAMTDQFLQLRDKLSETFGDWQQMMLDDGQRFSEWREFLAYKNSMQRLYRLCESQLDAVMLWQQDLEEEEASGGSRVHLSDLASHITRGVKFAQQLQFQIDSLMQLHYSLMTSQTNRVVQVLTVISAIFLPLTLITGIFGMNFKIMPPLNWGGGFYIFLGVMVLVAIALLVWFKIRRWV